MIKTILETPWLVQVLAIAVSAPFAYATWQRRFGPNGTYQPPGPLGQTLGCLLVLLMAGFAMVVGAIALVLDDSLLSVMGFMLPAGAGLAIGALIIVLWRWWRA